MQSCEVFVSEVRKAHAILMAYRQGAKNVQAITKRASVSVGDAIYWIAVFKLKTKSNEAAKMELPFRHTLTKEVLINEN